MPTEKPEAKSAEVAVREDLAGRYPVMSGDGAAVREMITENIGGSGIRPLDLDRIGVPAGGGTQWLVPTLDGEQSMTEIEGVVVAWRSPRVYWSVPIEESGGGSPPDCSSDDGQFGTGDYGPGSPNNPGGRCDQCPKNQWGSDPREGSRAKACKEMRQLFVLRPGGVLPVVLSLPPTSIQPMRKYFLRLAGESTPYYGVVSGFKLDRVTSGGFTWSVVEPRMIERLQPAEVARVKAYVDDFKPSLEVTPVTTDADDLR